MFNNNTVFVLGAGASWHYGYPTGEGLVEFVISVARRFSDYCDQRLMSGQVVQIIPDYVNQKIDYKQGVVGVHEGWRCVRNECHVLIERLQSVRPLLIDHFLAWNESLRPIGKLMIAAAILECEAVWLKERGNQNRRAPGPNPLVAGDIDITNFHDDWYRFIVHRLVYGCVKSTDLFGNNVQFVTFNYDASLEYHLFRALAAIDLLEPDDVKRFLGDKRIVHVYGSVHSGIPTEKDAIDLRVAQALGRPLDKQPSFAHDFEPRKIFLDRCLYAAKNLRTIDPHDKEDDKALERARGWIEEASVIYILGYGFDENNSRRIGLKQIARKPNAVMFTNFNDINTVNKRAGKLFFDNHDSFLHATIRGDPKSHYYEKSVRDVYEALEKDFDPLESDLVAGTKI